MAIRIRRGTDAQRAITTFLDGEIIWTTDLKEFWVGDGVTVGGILIGPSAGGGGLLSGNATQTAPGVYTTTILGVTAYNAGDTYMIKFDSENDGASTLDINTLGAVSIFKNSIIPLSSGDIKTDQEIIIVYDGTNFQAIGLISTQLLAYVHNSEGAVISKGQVVYAYQATGNKMSVKLARADGDPTSAKTIGMVYDSSIGIGAEGYIIIQGVIEGINTAAFSAGDTLYLSGTTFGGVTNVKPYAPTHLVYVGIVEKSNAGNGQIYVRCQNGYELDEIHDVDLITVPPVNNDVLTYNSVSQLWSGKSISTILGYTPVPNSRTLTINGTSYDLTANRSWSVGTVTSVGLALPTEFAISGSPVTGSGTLTGSWNNQTANTVLAGPTSGGAATPTFRALVSGDIPDISATYLTVANAALNYQPLDSDLTTIAGLTPANDDIIQRKAGAWTNRTIAQYYADLQPSVKDDVYFTFLCLHGGAAPAADSSVWHFLNSGISPTAGNTDTNNDFNLGYAVTLIAATIMTYGNTTAGTGELVTFALRNTTQNTTTTIGTTAANGGSTTVVTNTTITGLNIAIGASDFFTLRVTNPVWATNPVGVIYRALLTFKRA